MTREDRRPAASAAWLDDALDFAGLALVALYTFTAAWRAVALQWDYRVYLRAAEAARAGFNPYHLDELMAATGTPVALPFLYPPITLLPFAALASLPPAAALATWMTLKLVLLAGLALLWKRLLPRSVGWLPLALVTVFGSNGAALWDLRAGNVGIVEAALVWGALAAFVAGRRVAFAALLVAAACFKFAPLALLLLLFAPPANARRAAVTFGAALAAFALLLFGPLLFPPANAWGGFLSHLPGELPVGDANPSLHALATSYARGVIADPGRARLAALVAWGLVVALVLIASRRWLEETLRRRDPVRTAFGAAYLFVLLAPRPMAYGFALLAPAPLYFAPRPFDSPSGRIVLALVFAAQGLLRAANVGTHSTLLMHAPSLLALAVWLLIVVAPPQAGGARPESRGPRERPSGPGH